MKIWMWLVPTTFLSFVTALLQADDSSKAKAEFMNNCRSVSASQAIPPKTGERICSCIADQSKQFAVQNPDARLSKADMTGFLDACGKANGVDLTDDPNNPWD